MDLGRRTKPRLLRHGLLALALGAVTLATLPATQTSARAQRAGGKLVPSAGALFGSTIGADGASNLTMQKLEGMIGRKLDIVQRYYDWTQKFPTTYEHTEMSGGRIPMVAWRPGDLGSIINGKYDSLIRTRAKALKGLGHWVFLRFGWEMNGNWESWDGSANQPYGPSKFVKAWRHIHDIFSNIGALNVVWVWAPNWEDVPQASWNHWTHYYPGDKYVDWVGVDGFNWGTTQWWSHWTPISTIVKGLYRAYHTRKPIMVAESGSVEKGGSKAGWIQKAQSLLKTNFPGVAAFLYYNNADRNQPVNWAVTSSSSALNAYRTMAHDGYYNP